MSLRDISQVFMVFTSLRGGSNIMIRDLPVVCEFSKVFPYDISDLPLESEVEFSIDLVIGTSLMSMTPYKMFAS